MQLDGKIALITGGSSGIGRETAVLFAQHGAKLAIADLNPDGGQETVQMVQDAGGTAVFIQTDVSQAAQVENLINEVVREYGRLDIAFNNAGIDGIPVRTADGSEELDWRRTVLKMPETLEAAMRRVLPRASPISAWRRRRWR